MPVPLGPWKAILAGAFALVLLMPQGMALAQQTQTNWEPNRYRVKCSHDACLTSIYQQIENNLVDIVSRLKSGGWRAHNKFGPVVGTGSEARLEVEDSAKLIYAETKSECSPGSALVRFGAKTQEVSSRPHWVYFFFAHEMFHVTQRTYPAFNTCLEKRYGWVAESLATAVGLHFARQRFQAWFPITSTAGADRSVMKREVLSDAGGREYHMPLYQYEYDANGKPKDSGDLRHYRTSGLWRHLSEVWHGGTMTYVQGYLGKKAVGNDWLKWLHKNVEADLSEPLARVFAFYMADVANWHKPGQPATIFGEAEWHHILYDGCLKYTLSGQNPKVRIDLKIQRAAARCIQIKVDGLKGNQRVAVNAGAFIPYGKVAEADQLQLSMASSTDKVGLDCAKHLRSSDAKVKLLARKTCVFGFVPGDVKIKNIKNAGKIWDVVAQEAPYGGDSFTNTYILSRMAPDPTEKAKGKKDGGKLLKVSAMFVVDKPSASVGGKNLGSGKRRTIGHLNGSPANYSQETIPRYGKDGRQAIATRTPGVSAPSVPVLEMPGGASDKGGLWMLRFSSVNVEEDGMYQQTLVETDYMAALPMDKTGKKPRALRIGDHGTFKAGVSAKIGSQSFATMAPATLVVSEYSPFLLRATLSGTMCRAQMGEKKYDCSNSQPFKAEMIKAFAGFHDPSTRFVVTETLGTRQYARAMQALMSEAMSMMTSDGSAQPGQASSSSGRVTTKCNCSCQDGPYLQRLQKKAKGGKLTSKESQELRRLMRCMTRCTSHYIACNRKR